MSLSQITRLVLASVLLALLVQPVQASTTKTFQCGQDGLYTVDLKSSTIVSNQNCKGSVDIDPSVKVIGANAFSKNTGITSINFPTSVVSVEPYAFFSNTQISYIRFSNGLREIHSNAFNGLTKLTSIQLPDTL